MERPEKLERAHTLEGKDISDKLEKDRIVYEEDNDSANQKFIENWNKNQVKEWFIDNNLNVGIYNYFNPCDGEILKQLYEMKISAPEFFYKSLNRIENNDLRSIVAFSFRLNLLFSPSSA